MPGGRKIVGLGMVLPCAVAPRSGWAARVTPVLPREIEFMIIEHVHDKRTLSCCSLVCRAWLQVSRACLFHTITLRLPNEADVQVYAFARLLEGSAHPMKTCDMAKYVRDLTVLGDKSCRLRAGDPGPECGSGLSMDPHHKSSITRSPSLGSASSATSSSSRSFSSAGEANDSGYSSFMSDDHSPHTWDGTSRSLSMMCSWVDITEEDMSDDGEESDADTNNSDTEDTLEDHVRLPVQCLQSLLKLLPSLATLSLDKLSFHCGAIISRDSSAVQETPDGRSIQRLYIEDCSSRGLDARHFFHVLSLFSEVHVLCVDGGPWRFDQVSLIPRLPVVRGLVLGALEESDCATAFYESLRSSGSLSGPLKSIRFTGFTRDEVEAFFGFAQNAGPHLVDLELDIYYAINDSPGLPETWESLTLDFCSRLETLTFSFDFEDDDQPAWVCLEVVRTCLRFYTHLLSSRSVQRTLRIVTFQIFHAPAAPHNFRRSAESSTVPRWPDLDNALSSLSALSYVKFILCDVDGRGTEVEETQAGMAAFLQQYLSRTWESGRVRLSLEEDELGEMFQY